MTVIDDKNYVLSDRFFTVLRNWSYPVKVPHAQADSVTHVISTDRTTLPRKTKMPVSQPAALHNGRDGKQGAPTAGALRPSDHPQRIVNVSSCVTNSQRQSINDSMNTFGANVNEFCKRSSSTACTATMNRMQALEQITSSAAAADAHVRQDSHYNMFDRDMGGRRIRNRQPKHDSENAAFWAVEMMAFCRDATVVGLRNVIRPSSSRFRPIIWSLLILGGVAFTIYQSEDRIAFYLTWPTNVGVRVEYVDAIRFPMTTICNENRVSRRVVESFGECWHIFKFN
jgi:Amiloride-sensitive sodium channel